MLMGFLDSDLSFLIWVLKKLSFCCICRLVENKDMGSEGDSQEVEVVMPELDEKDMKSFEKVQKIIEGLVH